MRTSRVPSKYLGSLRGKRRRARLSEVLERSQESRLRGPRRPASSFRLFETDTGVKTKPSRYTSRFHARYGRLGGLKEIARKTRKTVAPWVSPSSYMRALREVYNRGLAAWATGHRPGATQAAWAYARVYSFVLGGKTRRTADADIAERLGID